MESNNRNKAKKQSHSTAHSSKNNQNFARTGEMPFIELLGPTPNNGFYRVRLTFYRTKVHFYMNKYGNVVFPKKHDVTTLSDEKAGEREWFNWARPKMATVKFDHSWGQKAERAYKELQQKIADHKLVKTKNAANPKSTLADVPGLVDGLKDLKKVEKKIIKQPTEPVKVVPPKKTVLKKVEQTSNPVVVTKEVKPDYGPCRIEKFNKKYNRPSKTANG